MFKGVWVRATFLWLAAMLLFGCSGGGCEGCNGVDSVPGGFPQERRLENAAQVRLTSGGIDFIESNIEAIFGMVMEGNLSFEVPTDRVDIFWPLSVDICPGGGCYVTMEIQSVNLVPRIPNFIQIYLDVIAYSSDASGNPRELPINIHTIWTNYCVVNIDTRRSGAPALPVTGRIVFTIDPTNLNTTIEFQEIDVTSGFENDDIDIDGPIFGGFVVCEIADALKSLFIGSLLDGLNGMVGDLLDVPSPLGVENQMDLGTLFSSFSPGLNAQVDLALTAGGYANAINGGLALGILGGAEPVNRASCVRHDIPEPPLDPIYISRTIQTMNDCPSCTSSNMHLAVGVSEAYLNRAGWAFHQSGALCLGIAPGKLPISTSTLSLLVPSIATVTWGEDSPVAIDLVPSSPPFIEVGRGDASDPLLLVSMAQVSLDFYTWGFDRYLRFLRLTTDVEIDINLTAVAGVIEVNIDNLRVANVSVTDSNVLTEDPVGLAASVEALLGAIVGPLLGNIASIELPPMMGFVLNVSEGGITSLNEAGIRFLMLYASLGLEARGGSMPRPFVDTRLEVPHVEIPPTEEFNAVNGPPTIPRVTFSLDASGAEDEEVEFRWRIDEGIWSNWTTEREHTIEHGMLTFQGRHRLEAQARLYQQPETLDPVPAEAELLIDTVAPELSISESDDGRYEITVSDMVSDEENILVEWRIEGDEAWQVLDGYSLNPPEDAIAFEARATDEAGNVGVERFEIRGRLPNIEDSGSGCGGCAVSERRGTAAPISVILLIMVVFLAWRRRSGAAVVVALFLTLSVAACSSGKVNGNGDRDGDGDDCETDDQCTDGRCCPIDNICVAFTRADDTCEGDYVCAEVPPLDEDCSFLPCANCELPDELAIGLIGLHSSVAVASDGTAWVSGYAAGLGPDTPYGDLVVAHVSMGQTRVSDSDWTIIDGMPSDGRVVGDPSGWREGIEAPGDDVGLYTSVAIDATGSVGVAYYDWTNGSLRYTRENGGTWSSPVIVDGEDAVDAGRFADLVFLPSGHPAIAYMTIEYNETNIITRARYVQAHDAAGSSWGTPVDLDVLDPTPCTATLCGDSLLCVGSTRTCETETADCGECEDGRACVRGECVEILGGPDGQIEGLGLWTDLAIGPGQTLGVLYYDRSNGNLVGVSYDGSEWGAPSVFAGHGGDIGWSPSLAIDAEGVWHATVVDGISEDLLYISSAGAFEIIDGRSLGDHYNIRGDDSSIVLLPDGRIRVTYQDVTTLTLWLAERDTSGLWTTRQLEGAGLSDTATEGYYSTQVLHGDSSVVSSWYFDPLGEANGVSLFWL